MDMQQQAVARKYATAFLNLYADSFSEQDYQNLLKAALFAKKKQYVLTLLSLPTLSKTEKRECLEKFFALSHTPSIILPLAMLLLDQQRIELWATVCEELVRHYQDRKHIVPFVIESAEALHDDQLTMLTTYLAEKTGKQIRYSTHIDQSLIAGIRMQSDTLLWEYSIAQQLRMLRKQ